ncbi:hypothetical protein NESM_000716900 [Novymonas esmeraldas]|uniref:Uncharacterized protein n=1 Tax=Novymonas esmeraldas TaxID=1808958 RepID=A0AAW0EXP9_9TRYP
MHTGTRRGLLLLGTHRVVVQSLHGVVAALYVEYYVHVFLLVVDRRRAAALKQAGGVAEPLHVSKAGLCVFIVAQLVYIAYSTLHRVGLVVVVLPAAARASRAARVLQFVSPEHRLALVFGAAWWVLRLPLVPPAVSFTLASAALRSVSERCIAFAEHAAREMAVQRPKAEGAVRLSSRVAGVGAAGVVFAAALLYDGAAPKRGSLCAFYWGLCALCTASACIISALQLWRGGPRGDDEASATATANVRSHPGAGDLAGPEWRCFARQTLQRRSMKALLAVHALHCYAQTVVGPFFHLLLTLGSAPHASAATRAAVLGLVVAAPPLLAPLCTAAAGLLGRKRLLSVVLAVVCVVSLASLVTAVLARVAPAAVDGGGAGATVWLCVVLLTLLRLLLDGARDVLELAQDDVVEEDAILFGRAAPMSLWTRRLCAVAALPMGALSCVTTLVYLAVAGAFDTPITTATPVPSSAAPKRAALALSTAAAAAAETTHNVASTVLALVGVQMFAVSLVMLLVWHRFYNLDGKHLQFVQMASRKRRDEQSVALV